MIASAKQRGARSLLLLQSNIDVDTNYAMKPNERNRYGDLGTVCHFTLQKADIILTQTELQSQWLKERFNRESVMLGNPFDIEAWECALQEEKRLSFNSPHEKFALWIGRSDRFHKHPLLFLKIARQSPHIPFVMILNKDDHDVRKEIEQTKPDNVQIVNHVPFRAMPAVFSRSFVFITTSSTEYEGLPNVFFQAAATNVPVLSNEFMPENMIRSGFAFLPDSTDKMIEQLNLFWKEQNIAHQYGLKGRKYIQNNSDINMYAEQISKVM